MAGKKKAAKSAPEKKEEFSLISNATLKALYADLRKSQAAVKNTARGVRGAGKNEFDALPAGVLMDLDEDDATFSTIADVAVKLKRKGKPAVQVSTAFGAALGSALLEKTRNSGKVGVVFGEADAPNTNQDWQEALNLARKHELPLIFVSRAAEVDEKEAARAVRKPRKGKKKAKSAESEGYLPRIPVDANDVVAVYRVAHESIERARKGRGPAWIEGVPFRPDGKRVGADAVANMETYLRGKGLL